MNGENYEKSINVLDFIEEKKDGKLRNSYVGDYIKHTYDLLCEYSHPNALGVVQHYFYTTDKAITNRNVSKINTNKENLSVLMKSTCLEGLKKSLEMCNQNYTHIYDNTKILTNMLIEKQKIQS